MAESQFFRSLDPRTIFGNNLPAIALGVEEYSLPANSSNAGILAAHDAVAHFTAGDSVFSHIRILKHESGRPYAEFEENLFAQLQKNGIVDIPVSIAHDGGIALGIAAIETTTSPGLRVGMDITTIERMKRHLQGGMRRTMTPEEIDEINNNVIKLGKRFTAKEAIAKVLGTGMSNGVGFRTMRTHEADGKMSVELFEGALARQQRLGLTHFHIRHAESEDAIAAFVLAHR